jgi:hypothetical protein
MNSWETLDRMVLEAVFSGRIGKPVFVRLLGNSGAADQENQWNCLLSLVRLANRWMGQAPRRVYATGSPGRAPIAAVIEYANGTSATIGTTTGSDAGAVADVLLLGNRGAIYYEGLQLAGAAGAAGRAAAGAEETLRAALEMSLNSGEPVPAPAGALK